MSSTLNSKDDIEESGFDKEDLGEYDDSIEQVEPFDPKKVDVSITTPNLGTLIMRLTHDEIDLMPNFQRSADLWSKQEQSRLIESILIRLPIPAFYFDALVEDKWQVVDGLQRLSAIGNFVVHKKLNLTNLEFLTELEGLSYDELPRSLQRRIDEFQTSVYLIKPGTPLEMKYSLFNRINTGGLKLNPQEIRHAMSQSVNSGAASTFLRKLVLEKDFLCVVINKNLRMSHEELALRHVIFRLYGSDSYKSSLPKFLNLGMIELGRLEASKLEQLKSDFLSSMRTAYDVFGDNAFKKSLLEPEHKKVVNKPLFEAVSVCLASLDDESREYLVKNKLKFQEEFKLLLKDTEFDISISKSTANTDNVQTRFGRVRELIANFLIEEN
ncbi:hypothetical protein VII00023_09289 [Vibrio ichthyoenteri ATCC 700023]|uniref:GmrSD restriction endonucleases N-terminal domain-containing protein n=1 Tax=Vibrio ichthyoenteri ATCC 700023 TaxID=870968 RepID=F9S6T7_9VIBR|nr:DUF262 domain-containing protein [Vibrio ichthyoenteri]EGU32382.1 hypothetical protein VII00023_09289 [Vibrio ichthyoenteri ATCC 700023]